MMHVIFRKNRASTFSADLAQTKSEQPVQAQAIRIQLTAVSPRYERHHI
jgi:hypothetical protein